MNWQLIDAFNFEKDKMYLIGSFPKGCVAVQRLKFAPSKDHFTTMDGKYHAPTHYCEIIPPTMENK